MSKLLIGICDDEFIVANQLYQIIDEISAVKRYDVEIHIYNSGQEVLNTEKKLDVLFLDIGMPKIDGIEVGRRLCRVQKNCFIIIATSIVERFKEAFEIQAFRFITKPFEKDEIEHAIDAVMEHRVGMNKIKFYEARMERDVMQREIHYLWSCDSSVEAYVGGRILRCESSLNEMERILDPRLFYRVHKRYLVNMLCIEKYCDGIVYMDNMRITVARRKKKEFELFYRKFNIEY